MSTPWVSLGDTIDFLEDLYYESLIGEPTEWDSGVSDEVEVGLSAVSPFHQLVFIPDNEPEPSWETIQRIIYRIDMDAIEEHSSISHPEEINRRPGQLAAVGSFGSVLWGIQDYVERSLVLSAALTVSALGYIHEVRLKAIEHLHRIRRLRAESRSGQPAHQALRLDPDALTATQRDTSWLKADLIFGAEASASISPLLQSLRVESYHHALYSSANVIPQAQLVGRMLDQIQAIVAAERGMDVEA